MKTTPGLPASRPIFRRPFAAMVLLGLALTVATSWTLWHRESRESLSTFKAVAADHSDDVVRELEADLHILKAGHAFFESGQAISRQEFHLFAQHLLPDFQTLFALNWVPRVPASERSRFEEAIRAEGFKQFEFTERDSAGKLVRAGSRPEYFPVSFFESETPGGYVLGFDLASDPPRLQAINAARASGTMQASARVRMLQETNSQWGCLVFLPVYDEHLSFSSAAPGPKTLQGFVLAVFRVSDLIETALNNIPPDGVRVEVYDDSAPPGERLLHTQITPAEGAGKADIGPGQPKGSSQLCYDQTYWMAGRKWRIHCVSTPAFMAGHRTMLPWLVLVSGTAFTGLLAAFLLSLFHRNRHVQRLVEIRTAEQLKTNRVLAEEIQARAQAEARLAHSLEEKELLLREIHHRVKNNLQIISSLLQLESSQFTEEALLRPLREMRNRIRSMALIYERIQGSTDLARIDFGDYLRSLTSSLVRSAGPQSRRLIPRFEIEPVQLNLDTAVPCGLIVTELVGNALRQPSVPAHSSLSAEHPAATLTLRLHPAADGQIQLAIEDNGAGLPANASNMSFNDLDMQIVGILTEQLGARSHVDHRPGTCFTLTFGELRYKKRI